MVLGGALWVTLQSVVSPVRISGSSMEPTCHNGQIKWVNRLAYCWSVPKRGDVVALQGHDAQVIYMKRLIGLPSETVSITNGVVLINGVPLAEPYLDWQGDWNVPSIRLSQSQYLVIGDNRAIDQWIHVFGAVERSQIAGRMLRGRPELTR